MKLQGQRKRQGKRKRLPTFGTCYVKDCDEVAVSEQVCILCDQQGKTFAVVACIPHAQKARERMKRHILVKHPSTIPAFVLAGLKGESID